MDEAGRKERPRRDKEHGPHPVDVHVGSRVELRRANLGLSRSQLARDVKLTFQQIQKFERGTNRISASRLYDLAQVLDVPVGFFFDDMPENLIEEPALSQRQKSPPAEDPMLQRETVELVRAFHTIQDRGLRKSIYDVTRALAVSRRFGAVQAAAPPVPPRTGENNGAEQAS